MTQGAPTVSILLGAGASYEANLPLATELTRRLLQNIDHWHRPTLEFVHSMMRAQKAVQASRGYYAHRYSLDIDSEEFYNTVSELADRDHAEIAPFVTMWHPMLTQLGPTVEPNQVATALSQAINESANTVISAVTTSNMRRAANLSADLRSAAHAAELIGKMIHGNPINKRILEDMQACVLEQVRVNDQTPVEYLRPIIDLASRQYRVSIGTLNYDTTIEQVCNQHSVPYFDGISEQPEIQQRRILNFRKTGVNLLKLHGSTSWVRDRKTGQVLHVDGDDSATGGQPVVRFGGRNKLTAEWPFFDLFWQWQEVLRKADVLWIIGYSFRDDHVNAVLASWFRADVSRKVVIVDPSFAPTNTNPFGQDLYSAPGASDRPDAFGNRNIDEDVRIAILRAGAGAALPSLVEAYPNLPIEYARSLAISD